VFVVSDHTIERPICGARYESTPTTKAAWSLHGRCASRSAGENALALVVWRTAMWRHPRRVLSAVSDATIGTAIVMFHLALADRAARARAKRLPPRDELRAPSPPPTTAEQRPATQTG
jgi:hypothetical protein